MAKKATIHDVARAANVSIATVSRVLNNPDAVRAATRVRVQKVFDEMGYNTTRVAASNAASTASPMLQISESPSRPARIILSILPDMRNPFYADVIEGITAKADYRGYEVAFYCAKMAQYSLKNLKKLVDGMNVCGVLLLGRIATPETLQELNQHIPVVQCAEFEKTSDLPYVSVDDYGAARSVMQLLLDKGKRRIALLNGPMRFKYVIERERGYCDMLREAGIELDPALIVHQSVSEFDLALSTTTQLLRQANPPDAIFAVSDVLAVAAIRAAYRTGLRVPQDIAVVGFDDTYISQMCAPSLTTVRQRGSQMGEYACEILIDLINGLPVANRQVVMDVDLLIREST